MYIGDNKCELSVARVKYFVIVTCCVIVNIPTTRLLNMCSYGRSLWLMVCLHWIVGMAFVHTHTIFALPKLDVNSRRTWALGTQLHVDVHQMTIIFSMLSIVNLLSIERLKSNSL